MRSSAVAVMFALVAPVLAAQQATVKTAAAPGDLDAELHYPTGQNAWIATSKPAYVALFDVTRSGVAQIYPTFSAQAQYPTGSNRRVIDVPYADLFGGSLGSFAGLHAATRQDGGWPHMLLLVASTSPLRVSSPWLTDITLNHDLLSQHHVDDLQTDGGIEALVDLIKPLDPDAEIAFDRLDGFKRGLAQYAGAADFNEFHTSYLGYYCAMPWGQGTFFTMAAPDGNLCSAVTPAKQAVMASTTRAAGTSAATRSVGQTHAITDPASIERFIDGYRSSHPLSGFGVAQSGFSAAGSMPTFDHGGSQLRGAAIGSGMGAAISAPTGPAVTAPVSSGARISSKP